MKLKNLIPLIAGYGLCLAQFNAAAQEYKTHISKQFSLQKQAASTLAGIYNIYGSVKVEGYNGDNVIIEVDETISGETSADIEQAKKEFKLEFQQNADTVMAYISNPWYTKPHARGWHYDSDRANYKVQLEFVVKVPHTINIDISTINNGDIDVKDVYGKLKVHNINGAIDITNAKGATDARTINGPVTVNYLTVPVEESSYNTINGKMTVTYPSNLSADLQFKSMNGEYFTDFEQVEVLPTEITKTTDKKANGTVYKMNKNTRIRIGNGGKLFKFETLNGNIYIKKQS